VLDDATNALTSASASVAMAKAQIQDAEALIAAAEADQQQMQLALDDLTITAPIRGRVLYRLREPGEVIAAGASLVTMLDLGNVYMNIYLSAPAVGTLALGDEARLILDPAPDYVIPARITFVSPQSQFTPKSVETQEQREELVFRVKLSVPRELLAKFEDQIKTGVRGIGFVRATPDTPWPDDLAVRLPE
jgi:HlyD family secretion protein